MLPGPAAPIPCFPSRSWIGTVVASTETLATLGIGLFDAHVGITKLNFDHVAVGFAYIDLFLLDIALHGLAQGNFAALIFSFIHTYSIK